jgi:hypothetical protein
VSSRNLTVVRVGWNLNSPTPWNEVTARALEVFGLPGDRYITHLTQDYLEYHFRDPHDATLFVLEHSGQIDIAVVQDYEVAKC